MARVAAVEKLPAALRRARQRFERWRRTRTQRRIPDELWSDAVELASTYGVGRTAQALRLNATSLRERKDSKNGAKGPAPFVELPAIAMESPPAGVLVLESTSGARMRIEVAHGDVLDIRALALAFLAGQ